MQNRHFLKSSNLLILLAGLAMGIGLGVLVLVGGPGAATSEADRQLPPTVGSPVPEFALKQLDGTILKLDDLKGKPVVINFWATWCPPCSEEMPLLQAYARSYSDRLVIVGVNYSEGRQRVQSYVDELGIGFPVILDSDGKVAERYFVRSYPTTFFVDAEGVLRAQHLGMLTDEGMKKYLETVGIRE